MHVGDRIYRPFNIGNVTMVLFTNIFVRHSLTYLLILCFPESVIYPQTKRLKLGVKGGVGDEITLQQEGMSVVRVCYQ